MPNTRTTTQLNALPTSPHRSIGHRIRVIVDRFEAGNASALARKCGYSQTGVSKVYRGLTDWPSSQLVASVIECYHVDPCWLMTGVPSAEWANSRGRVKRDALELAKRYAEQILERNATGYVEVEESWV